MCVGTSKSRSDVINVYQIQEGNLYGQYREPKENYDLMEIVILRLGPKGEASKEPAIRLLSKLFSQNMSMEETLKVLNVNGENRTLLMKML